MKALLTLVSFFAAIAIATAGPTKGVGRTIGELDVIPTAVLQRSISPKFYKSLLISRVDGWVIVRGSLSGTRLTGLRVVQSEPNGLNDHLALQRAKDVQIAGNFSIERPNSPTPVLVHLLLYRTADGTAALSFAHVDGPGGNQMQYYGCAKLSVLKDDGKWVDIKGPDTLEGKGLAVRQGIKNDLKATLKLDMMGTGSEVTNYGR
jgi:hypothetical protein